MLSNVDQHRRHTTKIKPGKFVTNSLCCTRHKKIQVHVVAPALLKIFKLNFVYKIIIL
jgi:hypothetical protein